MGAEWRALVWSCARGRSPVLTYAVVVPSPQMYSPDSSTRPQVGLGPSLVVNLVLQRPPCSMAKYSSTLKYRVGAKRHNSTA